AWGVSVEPIADCGFAIADWKGGRRNPQSTIRNPQLGEPKHHPRLLSHQAAHLELGERGQHRAGLRARRGDQYVHVLRLREQGIPERALQVVQIGWLTARE